MQAVARVGSAVGPDGRSRLVRMSGAPPLVPRATGRSAVHLVGAAGGPFPGDRTRLELDVAAGALLVVASAASTVALPGSDPAPSRHDVCARVGADGVLVVLGQPLVAARGSRHAVHVSVELAAGARLVWRDLLVPGRSGEVGGEVTTRLRVTRAGAPLLDTALTLGPDSPLGARCVGTLAVLGVELAETRRYGPDAALMPLAAGGALGTALGAAHEVERALARMAADLLPADLLAHLC